MGSLFSNSQRIPHNIAITGAKESNTLINKAIEVHKYYGLFSNPAQEVRHNVIYSGKTALYKVLNSDCEKPLVAWYNNRAFWIHNGLMQDFYVNLKCKLYTISACCWVNFPTGNTSNVLAFVKYAKGIKEIAIDFYEFCESEFIFLRGDLLLSSQNSDISSFAILASRNNEYFDWYRLFKTNNVDAHATEYVLDSRGFVRRIVTYSDVEFNNNGNLTIKLHGHCDCSYLIMYNGDVLVTFKLDMKIDNYLLDFQCVQTFFISSSNHRLTSVLDWCIDSDLILGTIHNSSNSIRFCSLLINMDYAVPTSSQPTIIANISYGPRHQYIIVCGKTLMYVHLLIEYGGKWDCIKSVLNGHSANIVKLSFNENWVMASLDNQMNLLIWDILRRKLIRRITLQMYDRPMQPEYKVLEKKTRKVTEMPKFGKIHLSVHYDTIAIFDQSKSSCTILHFNNDNRRI
ncbi:WD40-repeat-containing domain superfamily [Babesia duncani]|uniref:WD40-repeat-containing domain superfamily n=1 Tax=Babesia duncani TaxID=323732 RepID=A0AAD9UNI7_9APIC|nr:WD40-repeat-containing domain superfamily [Babesia duncani]